MEIEVVVNDGAVIAESPTWVAEERALYWIDVKKPALYRLEPETGQRRSWPLSSEIGAFGLVAEPAGAVVALREGIFRLDFASGALLKLASAPFDPALFRFNEGLCDTVGRLWVGVMFDPLAGGGQAQQSSLHSFTLANGLETQPDRAALHNGMAWSVDGRRFFVSHSRSGEIFSYDFEPASGRLGERSTFATLPGTTGLPDGAAVDTAGGYWCAVHGGGRLQRYSADGVLDREVPLPVSQPTMCAFAGKALDALYVTSASDMLTAEQRRREPLAGALLRLRVNAVGIARPCFVR